MDKNEAMKRLDAIEAEAKELRLLIKAPEQDYSEWVGKWGVFSDSNPECPFEGNIGKLDFVRINDDEPFYKKYGSNWKYFRPVTSEELGFTIDPDWSKAPKGAMWWARDANGAAFWYDKEPIKENNNAWWKAVSNFKRDTNICHEWSDTLRKRPE